MITTTYTEYTKSASTTDVHLPFLKELASDEADDLVAALLARERLDRNTDAALSLEESMRSFGLDPAEFGLE